MEYQWVPLHHLIHVTPPNDPTALAISKPHLGRCRLKNVEKMQEGKPTWPCACFQNIQCSGLFHLIHFVKAEKNP